MSSKRVFTAIPLFGTLLFVPINPAQAGCASTAAVNAPGKDLIRFVEEVSESLESLPSSTERVQAIETINAQLASGANPEDIKIPALPQYQAPSLAPDIFEKLRSYARLHGMETIITEVSDFCGAGSRPGTLIGEVADCRDTDTDTHTDSGPKTQSATRPLPSQFPDVQSDLAE